MPVKDRTTPYQRYKQQRDIAAQRRIPFLFTFEEWVAWWVVQLGPNWQNKRGRKAGQHVMARKGDKGPYAPWNVECITCEANSRAYTHTHGAAQNFAKLNDQLAQQIFTANDNIAALARQYNVSYSTIYSIRRRQLWVRATIGLTPGKDLRSC